MTINLNAYDKIEVNYNNKTWVNPVYKKLYSKQIEFKPYYAFLERYSSSTKTYDYYIIFSNVQYDDVNWHSTNTRKGTIMLNIGSIWNKTKLRDIRKIEFIDLEKVEEDKDSIIYYLNI